jgi:hypothetical protein
MIEHRPFSSLGRFNNDWLTARYHFSFSHYYDAKRMGWGALRVWNDDEIEPHTGFGVHGHDNMEIITYVREGAITHRDSLCNQGRTAAGDVQVMSAGSGIQHAEMNAEDTTTRLFQIWIIPSDDARNAEPLWDTRPFPKTERSGQFVILASGYTGDGDALPLRQLARVAGATAKAGDVLHWTLEAGRFAYLVVAEGSVTVNGFTLNARDGAAAVDEPTLTITATADSELVLVDVPA